jgi:hypothetical protein
MYRWGGSEQEQQIIAEIRERNQIIA